MPESLYRKYRPQTFAAVVNQQHVRLTLEHALEQDRVGHAYIFSGPRGVGKTTVARLLARAINCQKRTGAEPCNKCNFCLAMNQGQALDIIEIDAASQTGVDNVRENIIQSARVSPSLGKFKVFIIDEVHMLSLAAFNALLKLLEEPPAHAVFILATTEIHRLPETIISRTQRFDFKRLSVSDMAKRLGDLTSQEKRGLDDGVAERIARAAGGSMRDAESMLGQLFSFEEKMITTAIADLVLPRSDDAVVLNIIRALAQQQTPTALKVFHGYCDEGGDIPVLVHRLVEVARMIMVLAVDPTLLEQYTDQEEAALLQEVLTLAGTAAPSAWMTMVESFLQSERQLFKGAMMELAVEMAFIRLQKNSSLPPPAPPSLATPSEPTTKSVPKKSSPPAGSLNLAIVAKAWETLRTRLDHQPSLRLSVQMAQVNGFDGQTLTLTVPFALHQQRLLDHKHHQWLTETLTDIVGQPVTIVVEQSSEIPVLPPIEATKKQQTSADDAPKSGDLWDQVVASFQTE